MTKPTVSIPSPKRWPISTIFLMLLMLLMSKKMHTLFVPSFVLHSSMPSYRLRRPFRTTFVLPEIPQSPICQPSISQPRSAREPRSARDRTGARRASEAQHHRKAVGTRRALSASSGRCAVPKALRLFSIFHNFPFFPKAASFPSIPSIPSRETRLSRN